MGDALRKQLLKAGLANKKQAKAAEADQRKKAKEARKAGLDSDTDTLSEAQQALEQKRAADRARAEAQEAERRRHELEAQARDLALNHAIPCPEGDIPYHFADGTQIRTLMVTMEFRDKLSKGKLAIVSVDGEYRFVPAETAERIVERIPEMVVCHHTESEKKQEGPYADHPIPDDLVW